MDLGLAGRRAVVTGGSYGIGRAVAARLLHEGAHVAICARDEQGVRSAVKELAELGTVVGSVCDAGDGEAVRRWVDGAAEALGGLDVVVSNAGASGQHGAAAGPWEVNFRVDGLGCVALCKAPKPYLELSDAAAIVQ